MSTPTPVRNLEILILNWTLVPLACSEMASPRATRSSSMRGTLPVPSFTAEMMPADSFRIKSTISRGVSWSGLGTATGEATPPPLDVEAEDLLGVGWETLMAGLEGRAGLGFSGGWGLLPGRPGGGGPLLRPLLLLLAWREGGGGRAVSLGLREAMGGVGEGRAPLRDPRWGMGGPSAAGGGPLDEVGEEGRLGGSGGESLALGEVLMGDATLLDRKGPMLPLDDRLTGGGGLSCGRCMEGEGCLPLAVVEEEEGVW